MSAATDLLQELRNRGNAGDADANSYAARFETMRTFLEKNYYPYIQANCPWFTDHGKAHIEGVLWSSGQILQHKLSDPLIVTSFDIYLLATSIIWHDAGMVSKRRGHEQEVRKFLDEIAAAAFDDVAQKRLVEEIICAHTGRGTIQRLRQEERIGKYTAFPRALAGLLRFADEVSAIMPVVSFPVSVSGRNLLWRTMAIAGSIFSKVRTFPSRDSRASG